MIHELSIASINTWKCDGEYHQRMMLLATQLKEVAPDIILCQEAFQSECADTLKQLGSFLGMYSSYTPSRSKLRLFENKLTPSTSGLGLLSRYPVEVCTSVSLPTDARDGERIAQYCILRVNDAPLLIINTHLTHLKDAKMLRKSQLKSILEHPLINQQYLGIFLCGDFNAETDDIELQLLQKYKGLTIRNCYQEGKGEMPGHTLASNQANEDKCVDFIFSIENRFKNKTHSSNAKIILNKPNGDGVFPSDHFGVMVNCHLNSSINNKPTDYAVITN